MTIQNDEAQPRPGEGQRPNQSGGEKGGVAGVDSKDLTSPNRTEPKEKEFGPDSKTG